MSVVSRRSARPRRGFPAAALAAPLTLALAVTLGVPAAGAEEEVSDGPAVGVQETPVEDTTPRAETGNIAPPAASPFSVLDPGPAEHVDVLRTDIAPDVPGLPDGVEVTKVEWLDSHWANISITSPSMDGEVQKVQLHLARDWYSDPDRDFPSLWMLGGLWGSEQENGWSYKTDTVRFFADKNVNLVLPVGGSGSFYTDWQQPDNGQNYQWETFLTQELPPVLAQWRTRDDQRAVVGLSMGATSAVNLAARNPDMFDAVGSFSGYLDTTSPGMPQLFDKNLKSAGFDATKMWGPYYSRDWREHDPKLNVRSLRGKLVYVSAGNGKPGAHDDQGDHPEIISNPMEAGSRVTSQTFVNAAKLAGVDVIARWRPNGTHNWPYWEPELHEMWPMIAEKWGIDAGDLAAECTVDGVFAEAVERSRGTDVGECISNVYAGPDGGEIQDFEGARFFRAPDSDTAYAQWGRTGALYSSMGGASSWLGYPVSEEESLSKGVYVRYEHGRIHYTDDYGAVAVKDDVIAAWKRKNWEHGFGYPVSAEVDIHDADGKVIGQSQRFERGTIIRNTASGEVFSVQGLIGDRYLELGGPVSVLGFPVRDEETLGDPQGAYSAFENGLMYYSDNSGTHLLLNGPLLEAWKGAGYEHADGLGYPTSDEVVGADGSRYCDFERGRITVDAGGVATVTRTASPEDAGQTGGTGGTGDATDAADAA
ncbi:alpha/beta hydrolase-fold protein [Corynebacterium variabile]|uniref:alpha/beta hydrolase-fold protein n=1 Tax=Corynebacterium variabile TaxID=1727 RepID=UPI003FD178B5